MRYILSDPETTVLAVSGNINAAIETGTVLLLYSGGSNIALEVQITKHLQLKNKVTIGLIDERYGLVGHADSNWKQLGDAGFETDGLELAPVLNGKTIEETTQDYNRTLIEAFRNHDTAIGVFGIGSDGHTSGVLPYSRAVKAEDLVMYYDAPDYQRITTTPPSFGLFDQAYLLAYGENKYEPLDNLSLELTVAEQPAQALKLAKQLIIYNDQIGPAGADL